MAGGADRALGSWSKGAPAPTKRTEVAAASLGGNIYVVGGFSEPNLSNLLHLAISRAVEVYDPVKDSWSTRAPLPEGRHHAGIAALEGYLYVIGGFTASFMSVWHAVATVYRYDPSSNVWMEMAPMPTARGALGVAVYQDRLYAIGGYNEKGNPSAVEVFYPLSNSWVSAAPLPTPRDHLGVATVGSRIYAIGGRPHLDYRHNMATMEAYDPDVNQWQRLRELPTPRSGIAAGVIDGIIYVVGGEASTGTFATNEAFDPTQNQWKTMTPMPTARHGLGSAVIDRHWYVISGGTSPGGSFSNKNEIFSPPSSFTLAANRRASPAHVGAVMALLATLEDAQALPPETSPEANQLIHTLIQLQAVVMKSRNVAVRRFVSAALQDKLGEQSSGMLRHVRQRGINAVVMEALVDYLTIHPLQEGSPVAEGFLDFNVRVRGLALLQQTVQTARRQLQERGETLEHLFAQRRREMPGSSPALPDQTGSGQSSHFM